MVPDAAPRVTVAIPTRNRAGLLRDAIGSVLDQSLHDVEIFVSDNASTDETPAVVGSFRDPRIHYAHLGRNVGLFENFSRCMRLGSAPYLALLTDDDRMLQGSLERKVAVLDENPQVDMVHSSFELVFTGPDGRTLQKEVLHVGGPIDAVETGAVVVRRLLAENYWINPAVALIRRSVIGDERFDPADGIVSDLGISLRLARRCRAVAYIAEPLAAAGVLAEGNATTVGVYEYDSGTFYGTFNAVREARRVKERFLSTFPEDFPDIREIRAATRRAAQNEVLRRLKLRWLPDDSPRTALRLLRDSARAEPGILLSGRGARFLVKGLAGRRGRALVRALRGAAGGGSVRVGR